jgi:hypothetical protein
LFPYDLSRYVPSPQDNGRFRQSLETIMSILRCVATVLLSALLCSSCFAQSVQSRQPAQSDQDPSSLLEQLTQEPSSATDRGLSWFTSISGSHDSFSGWSSVMDSSMRYDFNSVFAVELGVPYYMMHHGYAVTTSAHSGVRPPLVSAYNTLGDTYLRLHFAAPQTSFHYAAMLTGTAPTGDTSSGISTGRPTFDLNNHIEHSFRFFTPMAEFGIGDSSALINQRISEPYASLLGAGNIAHPTNPILVTLMNQQIRQPYTTLGPISHYRAGATFQFLRIFSFAPSAYEDLPIGNQKVYSHLFVPSKTGKQIQIVNGRRIPGYETVQELKGQGILEDNGVTAEMTVSLSRHVALTGTYQRSLRQHFDTVAFGMSFTFGKYARSPVNQ